LKPQRHSRTHTSQTPRKLACPTTFWHSVAGHHREKIFYFSFRHSLRGCQYLHNHRRSRALITKQCCPATNNCTANVVLGIRSRSLSRRCRLSDAAKNVRVHRLLAQPPSNRKNNYMDRQTRFLTQRWIWFSGLISRAR